MPTLMEQVGSSWPHIFGAVLLALGPELIALGAEGGWGDLMTPLGVGRILAAVGAVLYAGRKVDLTTKP